MQNMSLPFLQLSLLKRSFKFHAQREGAFGFSEINVYLIIVSPPEGLGDILFLPWSSVRPSVCHKIVSAL